MVGVAINPGTEARDVATLENAKAVVAQISADLQLPDGFWSRRESLDSGGRFGFAGSTNGHTVEIEVPGDDPDEVCEGRPWVSRRLYVDGSSWLYGYALGAIEHAMNGEE